MVELIQALEGWQSRAAVPNPAPLSVEANTLPPADSSARRSIIWSVTAAGFLFVAAAVWLSVSGRQHPVPVSSPAVTAMKSGRQSQPAVSAPVDSNAPPSQQPAPAVKPDRQVAAKQSESQTKKAAAPRPDRAETQVYLGPKEGRLVWTGGLEPGETIDFTARDAAGSVSGSLPGVPVSIEVHPTNVHVVTPPAAANQWRRLVVRNDGKKQPVVLVNWTVVPR